MLLKVALTQTRGIVGDVGLNIAFAIERLAEASAEGAMILMLPELFTSGYNLSLDEMKRCSITQTSPEMTRLQEACVIHQCALAFGYAEAEPESGRLFNSAALIDSRGNLVINYRKTHLYGDQERAIFSTVAPPDAVGSYSQVAMNFDGIPGLNVALLICYDVEFPEVVRAVALHGANFIIIPTANFWVGIPEKIVPVRAIENHAVIAYINRHGDERGLKFGGSSCIVGPDGEDIVRANQTDEQFLIGILDLHKDSYAQLRQVNPYFSDRRPECYTHLFK